MYDVEWCIKEHYYYFIFGSFEMIFAGLIFVSFFLFFQLISCKRVANLILLYWEMIVEHG